MTASRRCLRLQTTYRIPIRRRQMTAQPSENADAAVAALIRAANIELIPLRGAQEKLDAVPAGTKITITCSPKFGLERTLEYAELAVKAGHEVVPHLAARQVA